MISHKGVIIETDMYNSILKLPKVWSYRNRLVCIIQNMGQDDTMGHSSYVIVRMRHLTFVYWWIQIFNLMQ